MSEVISLERRSAGWLAYGAHRDIPDFAQLSPHLLVPFEAAPLKTARVLWLNERWFLRRGVEILDRGVREQVCGDLLANFGVSTNADDARHCHAKTVRMQADRYGGSGGAHHGGSGRCGVVGAFNGKGIGRTPLAPANLDWDHSHGFLWLSEAIREAIGAEIAAAELPHGAVPVVAIIDTGLSVRKDAGSPMQRRAVLVRPNFLRPAHFERSIFFGGAGTPGSAQYLDAQRVRDAIARVTAPGRGAQTKFATLNGMFDNFAEQLGAARAHRLWQGRFLSSNLSVDGALVDFGSFRAVANWRRAVGKPNEVFGLEAQAMAAALESLCYLFRRFASQGHPVPEPRAVLATLERRIESAFLTTALHALGTAEDDPRFRQELGQLLAAYYGRQQADRVLVDDDHDLRRPWIHDMLSVRARRGSTDCREEAQLLAALGRGADAGILNEARTRLWLRPRLHMLYNIASRGARTCSERLIGADADQAMVSAYIARQVSRSRRFWPLLPRELQVRSQVCDAHSTALDCCDPRSRRNVAWVEGTLCGSDVVAFGQRIALEEVPDAVIHEAHGVAGFLASEAEERGAWREFVVGRQRLRLPRAQASFA